MSTPEQRALKRVRWHRYISKPENQKKVRERDVVRDTPARRRRRVESAKRRGTLRVWRSHAERKKRAIESGIPFTLTPSTTPPRPTNCTCCGTPFSQVRTAQASLDRVIPSVGYVVGNVFWICSSCNSKKSHLNLHEIQGRIIELQQSLDHFRVVASYVAGHMESAVKAAAGIGLMVGQVRAKRFATRGDGSPVRHVPPAKR